MLRMTCPRCDLLHLLGLVRISLPFRPDERTLHRLPRRSQPRSPGQQRDSTTAVELTHQNSMLCS